MTTDRPDGSNCETRSIPPAGIKPGPRHSQFDMSDRFQIVGPIRKEKKPWQVIDHNPSVPVGCDKAYTVLVGRHKSQRLAERRKRLLESHVPGSYQGDT